MVLHDAQATTLKDGTDDPPVLTMREVTKSYGGTQALRGVDLVLHRGEITAIVGQNGAGKSTLMKVLAGTIAPDSGTIEVGGSTVVMKNSAQAREAGIAMVHQELALFAHLDVLANLFVGREPLKKNGLVDRRRMAVEASPVMAELGLDVALETPLALLTLGQRQLVEIAKALLQDPSVLILDEPNSALNAASTERLLDVVGRLRTRGVAIAYISHRLEEVFRIADRIAVIRDGRNVETVRPDAVSIADVVRAMIGRDPTPPKRREARTSGAGRGVRFENVTVPGRLDDVSFEARPGEILGLAGLEGAGTDAIFDVIFGEQAPSAGRVEIGADTQSFAPSVPQAVRRGVARVPADRRRFGVSLTQSISENVSQVSSGVFGRHGKWIINRSSTRKAATERCTAIGVKAGSIDTLVGQLSGGNQQKIVLAKWLEGNTEVMLLDDPTRGVDVGAKAEIYEILAELAASGKTILFYTSELLEYGLLCDRVVVMYRGRSSLELQRSQLTEHQLLGAINTGTTE